MHIDLSVYMPPSSLHIESGTFPDFSPSEPRLSKKLKDLKDGLTGPHKSIKPPLLDSGNSKRWLIEAQIPSQTPACAFFFPG